MSEMLGNHYFLARKYSLAAKELEKALAKDPNNKEILRKLVICQVQNDHLERAVKLLWQLIRQDLEFVLKADPLLDDCPCPELVYYFEEQLRSNYANPDHLIKLAIFWLYCDIEKSLYYFKKYHKAGVASPIVEKIINLLTEYQLHHDLKGKQ